MAITRCPTCSVSEVPQFQRGRARREVLHQQDRQVGVGVGAQHLRLPEGPVAEGNPDGVGPLHDVVVGDDVALGVNEEAGAAAEDAGLVPRPGGDIYVDNAGVDPCVEVDQQAVLGGRFGDHSLRQRGRRGDNDHRLRRAGRGVPQRWGRQRGQGERTGQGRQE